MADLNEINNVITNSINNGIYSVDIDLSNYNNIPGAIALITLPVLLEKIIFRSNYFPRQYDFMLVATAGRSKDIEIHLENTFINSGDNIGIDLRGDIYNNSYLNKIAFSGENNVQSKNSIGILVMNEQNLDISGINESSILNVYGGLGNCAIGNSEVLNSGGHIVFSSAGAVNAYGGNALDQFSEGAAMDGGFGVGFVKSTLGSSSITIKCNSVVNAFGGQGQQCDVSNPNSIAVGNGGAGISLGTSGALIVDKCPNVVTSLHATGGGGGQIVDINNDGWIGNMRIGGNGGSAVTLPSGTVALYGTTELIGGNGTTLESQENLPVTGGNGGSAIEFTGNTRERNTVIINDDDRLSGGNGGTSGVSVDFDISSIKIISPNGGNGGSVINLGSNPSNVQIDGAILTSGSGGQGGSPKAYVDYGNLQISDFTGVDGANKPGSGGDSGSVIRGKGVTNLNLSANTILESGTVGNGGVGIQSDGSFINGESGNSSKQIDVIINSSPHFGYINMRRFMDFSSYNKFENQRNVKLENNPIIKNLYISQSFDSCLNVDNINVQKYYNIGTPDIITGNAFMDLIVKSKINAYIQELTPIVCKMKS